MGNHHGHHTQNSEEKRGSFSGLSLSYNGSRRSITRKRNSSTIDVPDKPLEQMLPLERLAKILTDKAQEEDHVNGVTQNVFYRYLFPKYPLLAEKLYKHFLDNSEFNYNYIPKNSFQQQCEKYLGILEDNVILDLWIKMWSELEDKEKNSYTITPNSFKSLLMCAYHVSMDHYSEGPQMCLSIGTTLKAVVDGCFYQKQSLSTQYVAHWLSDNAPRLLLPLHRFAVHAMATAWRTIDQSGGLPESIGLELTTPVLEQPNPFGQKHSPHLLTMSISWLLAGALPPLYSRPQRANSPGSSATGIASMSFLSKIACSIPSHWALIYDSDEMGLGSNRFLHHVLGYKGPTILIFRVENNQKFCVTSPCEWKESNHYFGGEGSAVFQLLPKFQLLEKGSKILYLNTTVRGYPQGLRAGSNPREPIIIVDGGFEKMEWKKIPYYIETIEVWGCGDQVLLEKQLEVKKWEVKEAEKQRTVKLSAADWLDHPDRYLLELAGRPQYHQNQT